MRGTAARKFQQIYDALESVGASLGFGASVHNTSFGGRALAEDLPLLLDCWPKPSPARSFPPNRWSVCAPAADRSGHPRPGYR